METTQASISRREFLTIHGLSLKLYQTGMLLAEAMNSPQQIAEDYERVKAVWETHRTSCALLASSLLSHCSKADQEQSTQVRNTLMRLQAEEAPLQTVIDNLQRVLDTISLELTELTEAEKCIVES